MLNNHSTNQPAGGTERTGYGGFVEHRCAGTNRGVEPLCTRLTAGQAGELRLREDAVTEAVDRQRNQLSAPAVHEGLFLVPKVIE